MKIYAACIDCRSTLKNTSLKMIYMSSIIKRLTTLNLHFEKPIISYFVFDISGYPGQLGTTDLRLRGQLSGGHSHVRKHHPGLGSVPHGDQECFQNRQKKPKIQGERTTFLQIFNYIFSGKTAMIMYAKRWTCVLLKTT